MSAGLLSGPRGYVRATIKCKLQLAVDRVCRLGPRVGVHGGLAAHTGLLSPPELSPTALPAVHNSQCLEKPPLRQPTVDGGAEVRRWASDPEYPADDLARRAPAGRCELRLGCLANLPNLQGDQ